MAAHRKFSEQDAESFSDEESDLARTATGGTYSRGSTLSSISESTYESVGSSSEESDFSRLLKDAEYAHTVDSDDASRSLPENWDELSWNIDTESLTWSEWEEISDEDEDDGLPLNLSKRVSKRRPKSLRYSKRVSVQDPTRESRRMSRRASKRMSLRRSVRIPGGFKRAFGSARSPNPFDSPDKDLPLAQLVELIVLGPFLVPIRVLWFVLVFVISSLLLQLSVVGANLHKPLGSIRMGFQSRVSSMAARAMLWSFGVTTIDVRGRQALPEQCRILVAASHSSPIDALVISAVVAGSPSAIVNASLKATALGSLLRATQSLFIGEDDVSKEVAARCDPKNKWVRPVCVFAEGARTNRTSLISFKPGPFDSGDPVQPILVGWSSDANVETAWPDEAPHTLSRLFQCFMGRSLGISVKFLPVILPSKKEKENVSLYMNKVRKAMAFDLGIPMSDYATVDLLLARAASKRGLRPAYVLDFSVAELSRELQVEADTLPEKIKLLLARYAKAPGMTSEGKINEKQFTRIAKKTALDVKRPTPLEWQDLVRTSALVNAEEGKVNTVSFRTFAIAHLTPSMLPAP